MCVGLAVVRTSSFARLRLMSRRTVLIIVTILCISAAILFLVVYKPLFLPDLFQRFRLASVPRPAADPDYYLAKEAIAAECGSSTQLLGVYVAVWSYELCIFPRNVWFPIRELLHHWIGYTGIVNNRDFRQYLAEKRLAAIREEVGAEKKPLATAKPVKPRKKRLA